MAAEDFQSNYKRVCEIIQKFPNRTAFFLAKNHGRDALDDQIMLGYGDADQNSVTIAFPHDSKTFDGESLKTDGQSSVEARIPSEEDFQSKYKRARELVQKFPNRAAFFLAENHRSADLEDQLMLGHGATDEIGVAFPSPQNPRPQFYEIEGMNNTREDLNQAPQPTTPSAPYFPPPGHASSFGRPQAPSPPIPGETILIYDGLGNYDQQPVTFVKVNVCHNWIRADVVQRLNLRPKNHEGGQLASTPWPGMPDDRLVASQYVDIRFRRPRFSGTEPMRCCITNERIDADVVEGQSEPMMDTPAHMPYTPLPHPLSPMPRPGSLTATWVQETETQTSRLLPGMPFNPQQNLPPNFNNMAGHQGIPLFASMQDFQRMNSAAPTQVPFTAPRAQPSGESMIKIRVKWDNRELAIKLSPADRGEMLLTKIEQKFERELNRDAFRLQLRSDADTLQTCISFSDKHLQADWKEFVSWANRNSLSTVRGIIELNLQARFNTLRSEIITEVQNPALLRERSAHSPPQSSPPAGSMPLTESPANSDVELESFDADDSDTSSVSTTGSSNVQGTKSSIPTLTSVSAGVESPDHHDKPTTMIVKSYQDLPTQSEDTQAEIESLLSVDDDRLSRADPVESELQEYREAATQYFVARLANDTELFYLYKKAARSLNHRKFVSNHRRLLYSLFQGLGPNSVLPSRKLALNFLGSRSYRTQISRGIYELFSTSDLKLMLPTAVDEAAKFDHLESYLENVDSSKDQPLGSNTDMLDDEENILCDIDDPEYRDGLDDDECDNEYDDEELPEEAPARTTLEDTARFLTSGRPFEDFKLSLRNFLQVDYQVSHSSSFLATLTDVSKECIEHVAGAKFSWWPLRDPEEPLVPDHVRVYSTKAGTVLFYNDIPKVLAASLFPRLLASKPRATDTTPRFLRREAVILRDLTLDEFQQLALQAKSVQITAGGNSSAHRSIPVNQSNKAETQALPGRELGEGASVAQNVGNGPMPEMPQDPQNRVLFVSVNSEHMEVVARSLMVGHSMTKDKIIFEQLQKVYRRLCNVWFKAKHITGVRFYRFTSFRYDGPNQVHFIQLEKDKERYPIEEDPEYPDYDYKDKPWTGCASFPGTQVMHYLRDPTRCGEDHKVKGILPIRTKGEIDKSDMRAFGIHFEERYSIWIVLLPSALLALLVLVPAAWFFWYWLNFHPGDLQNASVPLIVGLSVLTFATSIPVSLLTFRWTILEKGQS